MTERERELLEHEAAMMGGPCELVDSVVVGGCEVLIYEYTSPSTRESGRQLQQRRAAVYRPNGEQMMSGIVATEWVPVPA